MTVGEDSSAQGAPAGYLAGRGGWLSAGDRCKAKDCYKGFVVKSGGTMHLGTGCTKSGTGKVFTDVQPGGTLVRPEEAAAAAERAAAAAALLAEEEERARQAAAEAERKRVKKQRQKEKQQAAQAHAALASTAAPDAAEPGSGSSSAVRAGDSGASQPVLDTALPMAMTHVSDADTAESTSSAAALTASTQPSGTTDAAEPGLFASSAIPSTGTTLGSSPAAVPATVVPGAAQPLPLPPFHLLPLHLQMALGRAQGSTSPLVTGIVAAGVGPGPGTAANTLTVVTAGGSQQAGNAAGAGSQAMLAASNSFRGSSELAHTQPLPGADGPDAGAEQMAAVGCCSSASSVPATTAASSASSTSGGPHRSGSDGAGCATPGSSLSAQPTAPPAHSKASGSGKMASTSEGGGRRARSSRPLECVICMSAPGDAGFLHARSLHQGVCMECGDAVMAHAAAAGVQPMCAFCGQPAERVVKVHVCVD
eukprot:CAMPEP_0202861522 /NCGR_PEP_ID=MMETSP1391-20130828/2896_1 /ASSEMBLY_ACC=CAM_ASM_000867 /TAXON_ID=1034604 /ORGANISM="Chlamydomonas leiostraca, Strain SAG 11-49" /LENGTH=478 /DNA_ID=CAMNT_0049540931 /DNA_START=534 /DNA_END=1969 /DNA_ORIENTATION=-